MKYENITILRNGLTEEEFNNEINLYKQYFKDNNIKLNDFEDIGLRKLAYRIQNNDYGHYLRFEFETNKEEISKFEKYERKNDNVIKFLTVQLTYEEEREENQEQDELEE